MVVWDVVYVVDHCGDESCVSFDVAVYVAHGVAYDGVAVAAREDFGTCAYVLQVCHVWVGVVRAAAVDDELDLCGCGFVVWWFGSGWAVGRGV